jgi:hypothetical protein
MRLVPLNAQDVVAGPNQHATPHAKIQNAAVARGSDGALLDAAPSRFERSRDCSQLALGTLVRWIEQKGRQFPLVFGFDSPELNRLCPRVKLEQNFPLFDQLASPNPYLGDGAVRVSGHAVTIGADQGWAGTILADMANQS